MYLASALSIRMGVGKTSVHRPWQTDEQKETARCRRYQCGPHAANRPRVVRYRLRLNMGVPRRGRIRPLAQDGGLRICTCLTVF